MINLTPTSLSKPLALAACLLLGLFTLSCEQDELTLPQADEQALLLEESKANSEKINTYYGRTYPIGGGIMRSLVQINHNDEVVAIGMMISERSLHNLPHMLQQYVLDFHKKAGERTPFKHILFDWNPEGHEPDIFYGLPHFDLHLYTISNEERLMIVPDEPQTMEEIAAVWPYMPEGYVPTMDVVPQMGMHWIDPTAAEFQGEIFTHTMITGSYNDQFIFFEPMFTLDYLMGITSKVKYAIKPYAAVQEPGYYPTAYSFQYDPIRKMYILLLEDMEWR
jgi:hypothetical protein